MYTAGWKQSNSKIYDLRLSTRWNWYCNSFELWCGVILCEWYDVSGNILISSSGLIKTRIIFVFINISLTDAYKKAVLNDRTSLVIYNATVYFLVNSPITPSITSIHNSLFRKFLLFHSPLSDFRFFAFIVILKRYFRVLIIYCSLRHYQSKFSSS